MAVVDILKFIITGDNSGLKRAATEADMAVTNMSRGVAAGLSGLLLRFAGITAGALAFGKALESTVGEALESERVFKSLATTINATGGNWRQQEKEIRSFLNTFMETTRFTDEQGARALQVLVQAGMDVTQALSLMATTADLAIANQADLASAAEVMGRAFIGQTESLRRWNVFIHPATVEGKKFAATIEAINKNMGGAALADIQSTAGAWANFRKGLGELLEDLGNFLAKLLRLNELVNALSKGLKLLTSIFEGPGATVDAAPDAMGVPPRAGAAGKPIKTPARGIGVLTVQQQLQEEFDLRMRMGEKLQSFTNVLFSKEMAFRKAGQIEDAKFTEKLRLQVVDRLVDDEIKRQELIQRIRERGINALIDNSHRLASEFGRVMGAAAENFIHTMIEGIATIGGNLKALRAGGIAGLAGGAGLIGTAFSIVGSIVDLFKSSSEALVDSQGELIKTIKEWITSIRGDTSASLKAQREGIEAAKAGKILPGQAGRDAYLLAFKEASARFEALPVGQRSPEKFAELMAQVFNEMLAAINLQLEVFKSVDKKLSVGDVKNILTKTQKLDFQQGKDLIDFYSRQSDLSAADQIELLETLRTLLGDNITVQQLEDLTLSIKDLKEQTGDVSETGGKQIQITRSVASITENQANLVVGNLSTMNAVIQSIYELMQRAMDNFIGAASGIPLASGGGVTFEAGSIVIESSAQNGKQLAEEFTTSLRAKGVKV